MKKLPRPLRDRFLLPLTLLATASVSATLTPTEWQERHDFTIASPGLARIALPASTFDASRPGLPDLRLVDAAHGLVAYILSGKLHLLRLRDGRDVREARVDVTDARFSDTGLFYSFKTAGPWQGHIRFVPWRQLVLRP